ncbi:nuclear pore complex protein Nup160 [Hydra vulgaris]|uniref:nuclear pore complex protein Nup160 n=1 Tax=Hydra vulgaris TaxID=6087 RepID=UPI001F5F72F5|nr:nuclear pore complex protein Nup160 [Hydra vulgaris]
MVGGSMIEVLVNPPARGCSCIKLTNSEISSELKKSDKLVSDVAGGFTYASKSKITQNRHILWRVINDTLILEEISWNYNILSNSIEIKVPFEIILPNVVFYETYENIIVYFSTTNCIRAFSFEHPDVKYKHGPSGINATVHSIFHGASEKCMQTQVYVGNSCKFFDVVTLSNGDNVYGMITETGTLLVVNNDSLCFELKEASIVQRLWSGLVPSFVRGESSSSAVESLVMHNFDSSNLFAFTLCRDLKIRVWSIALKTCVHTTDLVSLNFDNFDLQQGSVDSLCLKKAKNTDGGQLLLIAHCTLMYSSQFIILEAFLEQKEIVVVHVSHFLSSFNNIQDISITQDYIWALWNTSDGDSELSFAPIEGGKDFERGWHSVHLVNINEDEIFVPVFQDVKEVFMRKLFSPQMYQKDCLLKALQIFAKTNELNIQFLPNESSSLLEIKESLLRIIDMQVENTVLSTGVQDSGYQQLQRECWFNFYSFVNQYLQARLKPVGLHVSKNGCFVIRQKCYGYVQPLSWSDHLYLSNLETCEGVQSFIDHELELNGSIVSRDIMFLVECMKAIPLQFNEEILFGVDCDLQGNEDVKVFLESMADALITNSSNFEQLVGNDPKRVDFILSIEARLKHLKNPAKAVEYILSAIDILEEQTTTKEFLKMSGTRNDFYNQTFCGQEGIEIISETLSKFSLTRMHFCRDFFILLKLMSKISCKINLDLSCSRDFGSIVAKRVYALLRSYHAVYWSANTCFQLVDSSTVEANLVHLAALNLTEKSPASKSARKTIDFTEQPTSLLLSFTRDIGIMKVICSLNNEEGMSKYQPSDLLHFFFSSIIKNIWLLNEKCSDFPEYLAAHCQYALLSEYLHFADTWCDSGRGTKDFLLGQSYLGTDEPEKALKYFVSAVRGIRLKEPLLISLTEDEDEKELLVQYFVKVMRLFEQWNHPLMVISAASSAIAMASNKSKNKPVLWSVVFKYHLQLGHYSEAYAAIVHNPDKTRRHDCLRHFIVTLCEKGMFKEICSYPYVNVEDEVVSIIEARARSTDITVNKYYDILYSYHILKSDYRKAATTMYEQSCRLATEMHGLKSLQKQAKCLLASLNALKLVESKYAWIVRPQENYSKNNTLVKSSNDFTHSPKRRENGEEIYYSSTSTKKCTTSIVIIEFHDLEKSYMLLLARLKLLQHGKNESIVVGPGLSASETVILLSQVGLFDMAFSLANIYNLPFKRIFETLASKCVNLVNCTKSSDDEQWNWLLFNEISSSQLVTSSSAVHHAFLLLQSYLEKFHDKSIHLKAVTSKLLSLGLHLPSWLVKDYELANPAELLHLYLCYDMINEATQLAVKYINAVLGECKEHLGLNTALHGTTPAVWLPYSSFDQLLAALKDNYENQEAFQLYEELQEKLDDYFTKLERVSCDKIEHTYRIITPVN